MDAEQDGGAGSGGRAGWQKRNQLPSFSRAFEVFTGGSMSDNPDSMGFFVPSYLAGSPYLKKLEEAHMARMRAQRELRATSGQSGAGLSPGGPTAGLRQKSGSHRGMQHTITERAPAGEEDELPSLPTRWNKDDRFGGIEVQAEGQEVKYTASRTHGERDHEACSIRADHAMPAESGLYYYEVTILHCKHEDACIGIGMSSGNVGLSRQPGWEPESWGYHSDDGRCYGGSSVGKVYGPTFGKGDVIGCGVNFRTRSVFFTKNGKHLGLASTEVRIKPKMYPAVGLKKTGESIRANFGQTPFLFNIDRMMEGEKSSVQKEIAVASTSMLSSNMNETELIQNLTLQFLQHDGYVETARAFAEEVQEQKRALSLDTDAAVEDVSVRDDEDANRRQRIRRSILEGDIDRALKYANTYYPYVLRTNKAVWFKLRCRKFIEMVRRSAELSLVAEGKKSNGFGNADQDPHEMELDVSMHGNGLDDTMDDGGDDDDDDGDALSSLNAQELELQMIEFGQTLQAEFKNDESREVKKALDEIWSLLAYSNPLKEPQVAHLLDRKGRAAVAEELNSAILTYTGKSSRAALEKLYAQTSVLLEILRANGGPGAFVSLQDVIDDVPQQA